MPKVNFTQDFHFIEKPIKFWLFLRSYVWSEMFIKTKPKTVNHIRFFKNEIHNFFEEKYVKTEGAKSGRASPEKEEIMLNEL